MTGERNDATPAALAVTVLLIAPLALRRRAPVAVFAAVMVACGLELLLVDQFLAANVSALIALYTLVAYAPRNLATLGGRGGARRDGPLHRALRRLQLRQQGC